MILISHRGNLKGRIPERENEPGYLKEALSQGFDVELDLWLSDCLFLGHDEPQYRVKESFLLENQDNLWVHCKNMAALNYSIEVELNCFFHDRDDFTLTSKKFIWTYPGIKEFCERSVAVLPPDKVPEYTYGICLDNFK